MRNNSSRHRYLLPSQNHGGDGGGGGGHWWLGTIDPWSFGWRWEGDWPIEDMRSRVRCGPPGI
ncbi:MAG: hypothetical protein PHO60_07100 [Methanothrix sp.]|nr:hypothetical protein [Methanothrix harundinacea]MDD2638717.1 hypothetical protein [Methanothrix sp.]